MILTENSIDAEFGTHVSTQFDLEHKVATKTLHDEDENPVFVTEAPYDEKKVALLIKEEIIKLENVIWNCKNTIAYSKDRPDLIDKEKSRMERTQPLLDFLKTYN